MAITIDDFSKIWASTSPLTPYSFSDDNYKSGWNFIGSTPPSRQMWDFLQKNNDEKMQYLADNYLPLSGGTMTGDLKTSYRYFAIRNNATDNDCQLSVFGGGQNNTGAYLALNGKGLGTNPGSFTVVAHDGTNAKTLQGNPDGTLTWDGAGLGGTSLGVASSGVATNFTLPNSGTYLVVTGHNSNAGLNSIFIVRTNGNSVFNMAGGSNITMTCSGTQITVTASGGSVGVYYIYLG